MSERERQREREREREGEGVCWMGKQNGIVVEGKEMTRYRNGNLFVGKFCVVFSHVYIETGITVSCRYITVLMKTFSITNPSCFPL